MPPTSFPGGSRSGAPCLDQVFLYCFIFLVERLCISFIPASFPVGSGLGVCLALCLGFSVCVIFLYICEVCYIVIMGNFYCVFCNESITPVPHFLRTPAVSRLLVQGISGVSLIQSFHSFHIFLLYICLGLSVSCYNCYCVFVKCICYCKHFITV